MEDVAWPEESLRARWRRQRCRSSGGHGATGGKSAREVEAAALQVEQRMWCEQRGVCARGGGGEATGRPKVKDWPACGNQSGAKEKAERTESQEEGAGREAGCVLDKCSAS